MRKRIIGFIVLAFALLLPLYDADAASLNISAASTNITNGNSVKVTVNASGLTGKFSVTSSNSGVLSGGTGSEWFENESKTYTFNSKGLGSATITVKAIDVADSNGNKWSGSKSVTIKVNKPREKSTNNDLKSLSVEGYELTPAFEKDKLEYSVEIGDNAEKIKINAEKADGYANLEGDGEKEVVEGANKFEIKVTSETGVEKVYTLNVNVKDSNPLEKKIDGENFTVIKRIKSLVLPDALDKELFKEEKVKIDDIEVPAYSSDEYKITLIGLKDKEGNIYLYKYENGKIADRYEILTSKNITVVFTDAKNIPKGYTKTTIKILGKNYTAYQNDYKDYALIYGATLDTGKTNWYSYNLKENTIQLYNREMIDDMNEDFDTKLNQTNTYMYIAAGVAGFFFLMTIILLILVIKKKGDKPKKDKKKIEEEVIDPEAIKKELENTKEIDATEIIIKKEEEEKKEAVPEVTLSTMVKVEEEPVVIPEPVKKEKKKKNKKNKNPEPVNTEFLNTEDLREILDNPPAPIQIEEAKEVETPQPIEIEDEMDTEFLDYYKGRRKKNRN